MRQFQRPVVILLLTISSKNVLAGNRLMASRAPKSRNTTCATAVTRNRDNVAAHLFPSAKLTSSSQWLSQEISLFLHEVSLSLEISVHKSPQRKFFPLQWISHGTAMGTKTAVSQVQVQVQVHLFTLIQLQYNNNKE